MTRVLAASGEDIILHNVSMTLMNAGFLVDTAADGEGVIIRAREASYQVIVLDANLRGSEGLTVCQDLRRESWTPILMLTGLGDEEARVKGLDVGADDCLTKPFSPRELAARVRALLRRAAPSHWVGTPSQYSCLQVGGLEIDLIYRRATHMGKPLRLSPKEFDLLVFLAKAPGRIFTQSQLLEEVWRFDNPSDVRTVSVHVWCLRQKLEADPSRPTLIQTVRGKGYRLASEGTRMS